ncbi:MAG: diguanylate cyclase [Candidatus Elarobacter sp.]
MTAAQVAALAGLLVVTASAVGVTGVAASDPPGIAGARPQISIAAGSTGVMTLDEVRNARFTLYDRSGTNAALGATPEGEAWLRFAVSDPPATYLLLPASVRSGVVFAVQPDGTRTGTELGTVIPVVARPFESDENVVRLPEPSAGTVYYVRLRPAPAAIDAVRLFSPADFAARERLRFRRVFLPTIFLVGAIGALAVLGALLGILLRERSYLYYACTLAAFAFADVIDVGAAARWLWPHAALPPDAVSLVARHVSDGLLLAFCLTIGGSRRALDTRQRVAIGAYAALFITTDLIGLLGPATVASLPAAMAEAALNGFFLSAVFVAIAPHVKSLRARNNAVVGAFGLTFFGIMLGRAGACGLIPISPLTEVGPALALVIQAMVLAGVLARRVRRVEAAKASFVNERCELEEAALRDVLTGIPNRRAFDARLAEEWQHASRADTEISIILIDVDHFKLYNDALGHTFGDEVLHDVARTIAVGLRGKDDFVARYGGEEFIIILPSCVAEEAGVIAERLRSEIESLGIRHPGSPLGVLTISAGAASASPRRCRRAGTLVVRADSALYDAKRSGRNRICVSGSVIGSIQAAGHAG